MPNGVQVNPSMGSAGITFAVDAVIPAEEPVWTETLADSLSCRFQSNILVLPGKGVPVINADVDAFNKRLLKSPTEKNREPMKMRFLSSRCHPFIDAVHTAFSLHLPLTLSPDAIWLLLAQGFSHHISENAESLRPRLVRHEGKRELRLEASDMSLTGFETAIADFSSLIREEIDPVLHEALICDFSTTSPAIKTACEVALMDSFASYFLYSITSICGIPKITILGTPQDWQRIRARIEVLAVYELEWWVSRLRPILDEFTLAAEGHPTPGFWQAIYKPKQTYGDEVATGWITDLFPYLGDAPERRKNHVFDDERRDWALALDHGVHMQSLRLNNPASFGAALKSFPSGLSSARIKVALQDHSPMSLDLVAGFFAVSQDPSNLALSPLISWCVAELPRKRPAQRL